MTRPPAVTHVTTPRRTGRPLGYRFAAVPTALLDAIDHAAKRPAPPKEADPHRERERRRALNDRLRSLDANVLAAVLEFPRVVPHLCWCTVETVATKLGKSERSVRYSFRRLAAHGFIEHVPTSVPDSDDPRNSTGWKIVLVWLAPDGYPLGRGPDRRPPLERKAGPKPPGCIPPPGGPVAPPRVQPVAPNNAGASDFPDGRELEGETPSSSLRRADDDDVSLAPREETAGEGLAGAIDAVRECFGGELADQVRADAAGIGRKLGGRWDCFRGAVYMARERGAARPLGYVLATARDYAQRGGVPAEAEASRARFHEGQRAQAERDRRSASEAEARRLADEEAERSRRAAEASVVTPAQLEQFRAWASGRDPGLARLGRSALAQAGVPPGEIPAAPPVSPKVRGLRGPSGPGPRRVFAP